MKKLPTNCSNSSQIGENASAFQAFKINLNTHITDTDKIRSESDMIADQLYHDAASYHPGSATERNLQRIEQNLKALEDQYQVSAMSVTAGIAVK